MSLVYYAALVSSLACYFLVALAQTGIELGYTNVYEDTINGATVLESGEVPTWLSGSLLRQSCGAYGETFQGTNGTDKIDHLLDCIEMGQSFRFENGTVTFYNRYFDTAIVDVWRQYDMNMTRSQVFWRTIFSDMNADQVNHHWNDIENAATREKVRQVPHVTWWQIGDKVLGHSEYPDLVEVNAHDVFNAPYYHVFDDNNFGYSGLEAIVDEASHEAHDVDGTLYSTHMTYQFDDVTQWPYNPIVNQWKNVYKIVGNERISIAHLPYPPHNMSLCDGVESYPHHTHKQGYMHSFTMSQNYVLVPESSYLTDICKVLPNPFGYYERTESYYTQFFEWFGDVPSRMWVVRKSDGRIMNNGQPITTQAFFVTHQINAYEEGNFIYADMITYNHGNFYTEDTYIDRLTGTIPYEAYVHRFTIDMRDWTMTRHNILPTHQPIELPMINQAWITLPYTYVYYVWGIHTGLPQNFTKLNMQTGKVEAFYEMPDGFFPQEPTFVQTPDAVAEDDGVILLAGLDSVQAKGFLMIFDARDLSLTAHVTGTDLMLCGLHSKFFPPHIGNYQHSDVTDSPFDPDGAASLTSCVSLICSLLLILYTHLL